MKSTQNSISDINQSQSRHQQENQEDDSVGEEDRIIPSPIYQQKKDVAPRCFSLLLESSHTKGSINDYSNTAPLASKICQGDDSLDNKNFLMFSIF